MVWVSKVSDKVGCHLQVSQLKEKRDYLVTNLRRTTSDQKARKLEIKENTGQTGIPLLEGEEIETNNKSSPEDLFQPVYKESWI